MAIVNIITANCENGQLSQQQISRQWDNLGTMVQFAGYPQPEDDEELIFKLKVWMKESKEAEPREMAPILLDGDQWLVSNFYTQLAQTIKFQLWISNESETFVKHSPIFAGHIGSSLSNNGEEGDIDVIPLFDPYMEYVDEKVNALIVAAGAVQIDATLRTSGAAADAKATGDAIAGVNGRLEQYVLSKYRKVSPTNWLNVDAVTTGYVIKANGTEEASSARCYTDYIPVSEGDKVRIFRGNNNFPALYRRNICLYDADKNVVSGGNDSSASGAFTIPSGVSFVRVSMDTTNLVSSVQPMIVLDGVAPTAYSAYFEPYETLADNFLNDESEAAVEGLINGTYARTNLSNRYACSIPRQKFRMTLELQQPWYVKSLVFPKNAFMSAVVGNGAYQRYNNRIEFIQASAGSSANGYRFAMYDEVMGSIIVDDKTYASAGYGLERVWVPESLSSCSLLCIGDSTVDHDTMTATILSHFAEHNATVTLLGTLGDGSGTNKNEGRAGWKATDYLTNKQYQGVVNPFYNPTSQTFDFSYYMTQQNYSGVDFVVIQLGINDLYNIGYAGALTAIESTWAAVKAMIDSILSYNSSAKIILNLPTTPNSDQSTHSVFLPIYENTVIKYNDYAQEHALKYSMNNVRCSYCHLILDPDTEIRDNVHPTVAGYQKMALEVVNQINCWQAGV